MKSWLLPVVAGIGFTPIAAAAQDSCSSLAGKVDGDVVVMAATSVAATTPWVLETSSFYKPVAVNAPFCRIEGVIEGTIGFELWMPQSGRWNGRLLGAGVGGDAGVFNYSDMSLRLNQGFATLSTDSGHKVSEVNWMLRPKARVDYETRAVHLTTVASKSILAQYYGRLADRSYFLGCSGGGRQALKEMQDHPGDYDGIISGAPGPNMPLLSVRQMWVSLLQKWQPADALTDADWSLYESSVVKSCDAKDGVTDGIIENPQSCRFNVQKLSCKKGSTAQCLSTGKLSMLKSIVGPLRNEKGSAMDAGLLAGVRTRPGPASPLLRAMFANGAHDNPEWDENSFSRTGDLALVYSKMPDLRADKLDISAFQKRGGKAIIYQGWQDPSVVAGPTVNYYRQLAEHAGGFGKLSNSVRLFMAPGMYHCRGGPGADDFGGSGHTATGNPQSDIVWAMIDWVEKGIAPAELIAGKRDKAKPMTRKLCAYPASARYMGGPTDLAASFQCTSDGKYRI